MKKMPPSIAVDYYNIAITGLDILYELSLVHPGVIEDLGNIARLVIECTGKRSTKFSARTMDELSREALPQSEFQDGKA